MNKEAQQELQAQIEAAADRIAEALKGESINVAIAALAAVASTAIIEFQMPQEHRQAAAMFFLSVAAKVTETVGISDKDVTSAIVQPDFITH